MHQRSNVVSHMTITGMFMPAYMDDQPVIVRLENIPFLPIFSTLEKLEEQLPVMQPGSPTKVKLIMDGRDFLASVLPNIRVMLDPFVVDGNTRFTEIVLKDWPAAGLQKDQDDTGQRVS